MTITITSSTDKKTIKELLSSIPQKKGFDSDKHFGKVKFKGDPLEIQKKMRDEWG